MEETYQITPELKQELDELDNELLEEKIEALAEYYYKNGLDLDGADIEKVKQDIRNWGKAKIQNEYFLIFDSEALEALHPEWFEEDEDEFGEEVVIK